MNFAQWCSMRGVAAMPAPPSLVVEFIRNWNGAPIEMMWPRIREISAAHVAAGYADPTAGGIVGAEINSISGVKPPRSFSNPEKALFAQLPYDVQMALDRRITQTEIAMRRAQSEAGALRSELEKRKHGAQQTAAA